MSDFWTRRRAAVAAEKAAQDDALRLAAEAEETRALEAAQAEKTDEEILQELGLPDPDALQPGQDVAGFMRAAVPERLRRRALRQLWRLNPALANLDMLVEYGEDYTDAATVIADLSTTYQVGKGMLEHVKIMEAKAKALEDALSGEAPAEAAPEDGPDLRRPTKALTQPSEDAPEEEAEPPLLRNSLPEHALDDDFAAPECAAPDLPAPEPAAAPFPAPRRRMRFAYPEA